MVKKLRTTFAQLKLKVQRKLSYFDYWLMGATFKMIGGFFAIAAAVWFLLVFPTLSFQVLSFMDLDFNDTEIIISGVGKDLFLKESLRLFSNVKDAEEYLYPDLCINLESFAIAMAIAKEKLNLHIMEGVKTGKKN